jgi:zinc protease
MLLKNICLVITGTVILFGHCLAQENPLPLDPAVRVGKLANGFTYYIRHNEAPKNRVIFYLANKVGSILETNDQLGLAHFMEHMTFNGSRHFPKNSLVDELQTAGLRFGADINAYTGYDETIYQLPLPTDKPGLVLKGLQIMRDWAQEATLDPKEIDKERGVVLEEKRLGKGAGERMQRQYYPMLLNHSRYAERNPIGTEEVLNNFKPETIKEFYHTWYRPDLQALIVVGDIDVKEMESLIKAKFSDLKNPDKEEQRTNYTIPLTGKNQFIVLTDKEFTATVAEVAIKHPASSMASENDYKLIIEKQLFNAMIGARLAELSQQADAPFIQGSADIKNFMSNIDTYNTTVSAKPGELEKGFKALWRETERARRFGFTQTELDRAKSAYQTRIESILREKDKTSSDAYVQEYMDHFLKSTAAPGIEKEYQMVKAYFPVISLDVIQRLCKIYVTTTDRDIIVLAPEKEKDGLPNEKILLSWMQAVESENLSAYQDQISEQTLLIRSPIPGKVVSEEKDASLGITTLKLSNGVKVILKPTTFKNDEIIFSAFSPGGTSLYNDGDSPSASNAAGIVAASGAGNFSSQELDKYLSGKQLEVRPFLTERTQGISGGASVKDFESALQLTYAYLTEPRKDTAVFRAIISRTKARLPNRANDPASVFNDTVTYILGNYNIRRTAPSLAKLERISLDRVWDIYRDRFADAAQMTFVFTGNIDSATIKPLIEKYIGSLPAKNRKEEPKDIGIHIPDGIISKTVYKGSEPKAAVILVYSGLFEGSAENRMRLEALQETLSIRLIERLREDESGVYSPKVSINTNKFPQSRFSLIIRFGCAPQNVDKLIASAVDEVNKLKSEGPLEININKWKAAYINQRRLQLKENSWWLNYISDQIQNKDDLHQLDSDEKTIGGFNQSNLQDFAKRYIRDKNFIRFVLLPEYAMH